LATARGPELAADGDRALCPLGDDYKETEGIGAEEGKDDDGDGMQVSEWVGG